jgi:hypothetical protein
MEAHLSKYLPCCRRTLTKGCTIRDTMLSSVPFAGADDTLSHPTCSPCMCAAINYCALRADANDKAALLADSRCTHVHHIWPMLTTFTTHRLLPVGSTHNFTSLFEPRHPVHFTKPPSSVL